MSDCGQARPSIADLSLAVADGAAIDWDALASDAVTPADRVLIDRLRIVEQMAAIVRPPVAHAAISVADELRDDSQRGITAGREAPAGSISALPVWGHLQLIELIGRGAFGEVYRARDTRLDREVALKILRRGESQREELATSIVEEGRLLARIRHPNVVTVYGGDRIGEHAGVWMELVRGQTLEEQLQRRGPFAVGDLVRAGLDLCRALTAVHRAGLIHRDVKAQNVMEDDDGRHVLMDFGIGFETASATAARAHAAPPETNETHAPLTGTPLYLAPEIFDGHAATVQSDLYAVGVLLYHLATGSYPVAGRTADDLRAAHARGESMSLEVRRPQLNRRIVGVIQRALAHSAADRYESAEAMEAALADVRRASERADRTRKYSWAMAGSTAAVLLGFWLTGWLRVAPRDAVVNLIASGAELHAVDRDGDVLWRHRVRNASAATISGPVLVADLDGDGPKEVLATVTAGGLQAGSLPSAALYCFSQDGEVRWTRELDARLTFRAGEYEPPWRVKDLLVYRVPDGLRIAVAVHHHTWWPSLLDSLDSQGRFTGERFVNAGWMMRLGATADARHLLAAGVNNAHGKATMLAVLAATSPSGASPESPGSEFECLGCPAGAPLKYFVFSPSDVKRASASEPTSPAIIPTGNAVQLRVAEFEALHQPAQGVPTTPEVIFEFSSDFQVKHASFTDSHWAWHRRLQAEGRLDHSAEACPERAGLPIRVWEPRTGWRDVSWPVR